MKMGIVAVGLAAALIVAVAWEEMRIQELREQLAAVVKSEPGDRPTKGDRVQISSQPLPGDSRSRSRLMSEPAPRLEEGEEESEGEQFATSVRKIFENPASKAIISDAMKGMAADLYGPLIEEFALNEREKDYFLKLIASASANQQAVGMKMFSAETEEERGSIVEEMVSTQQEREDNIREFLNNAEDFARFEDYEKRVPERQQIGGIRVVMEEAGVPLSAEQEGQLMDAMYEVRTDSGITDEWGGTDALEGIAEGEAVERFERSWSARQNAMNARLSEFLSADQAAAFREQQEHVRELQLVGLRMAEQMFRNKQPEE